MIMNIAALLGVTIQPSCIAALLDRLADSRKALGTVMVAVLVINYLLRTESK